MARRVFFILVLLALVGIWIACSGGNNSTTTTSSTGSVITVISDPTTCGPPNGVFTHVYVTVTDVKIHQSATAAASDAGWVDLTPGISPQTIDLLGNPNNQCFLAQLSNGSVALQAGSYQQIRIILASSGTNTSCGNAGPNCVVLAADTSHTPQPLLLSSQDQTGIKIPAGQIAGGQFTIAAGQSKDLDVHFDACASIVMQGNNKFRMKPVLLAGEVSLQNNLISGALVDKNGAPLTGLTAVATLQQKDTTSGFDVVKQQLTVDPVTGKFSFCPLLIAGTADLVVVAYDSKNNISYAPAVVTGVAAGAGVNVQMLPVSAVSGTTITTAGLSSIKGEADTTNAGSTAGVVADVTLGAVEDAGNGLFVTIPVVGSTTSTPTVTTAAPVAPAVCLTANTDCAQFTLQVPGAAPNVGAAGATITWTQAATGANYKVQGTATTCTPQTMTSDPTAVPAGTNVTLAKPLVFVGCS